MPGACDLAEWNVPHAPYKHRSLLVQIDEARTKGLAPPKIFFKCPSIKKIAMSPAVAVFFFLSMPIQAQLNQAIDEFGIRYARRGP